MQNTVMNTTLSSEHFNQGVIFNEKTAELLLDGTTYDFIGTAIQNNPEPGGSGFHFSLNTTTNPAIGIDHPYAFRGETGGADNIFGPPLGIDRSIGSWVNFGDVPGDEGYLSPPRYEVRIVTSPHPLAGLPSFPSGSLITGSQWLTGNFETINTTVFAVEHSIAYGTNINPLTYPNGRGNRYTVTIREIGNASNTSTIIVDLRIVGQQGGGGIVPELLP